MITDKQRRKVAQELRKQAAYCDGSLSEWWQRLQDTVTGEVDFADPKATFRAIANLIDRLACRDVSDGCFEFFCSKCGCSLDISNDYEPTMWVDGNVTVPSYCPMCGAEVLDEDGAN